jgi:hypothetical protein
MGLRIAEDPALSEEVTGSPTKPHPKGNSVRHQGVYCAVPLKLTRIMRTDTGSVPSG